MTLTVACVLYQGRDVPQHSLNIFTPLWVDRLYCGIERNLSKPFRFVCFVDREYVFEGPVEQELLDLPYRNMMSLLEPLKLEGKVLFMGLDTVITGSLDEIASVDTKFAMTRDPNDSKRGCSGVMLFENPGLWDEIKNNHQTIAGKYQMCGVPSDMMYLTTLEHDYLDNLGIYSYKNHIKRDKSLLDDARIVYFHGREKPHEIDEDFVREHWV